MTAAQHWVLPYLLNSAWQVPLLLLVGLLAARVVRFAGPATEHRVWVTTLLLQVLLPAATVWRDRLVGFLHLRVGTAPVLESGGRVTVVLGDAVPWAMPTWALTLIIGTYCAASVYFAFRLVRNLAVALRLRRRACAAELDEDTRSFWTACEELFRVGHVGFATSDEVFGPVTLGVRRPIVIVPPWMLQSLREADLRTVTAHEFAHIGRHDFMKNLLYEAVSLPVKYHPAFWIARARLVESREMTCDAAASAVLSGPSAYADSLIRLASNLVPAVPALNHNAIGLYDAHSLERRIMRLTEAKVVPHAVQRAMVAVACVGLGLGTCAPALWLGSAAAAEQAATASTTQDGATGQAQSAAQPKVPSSVMTGNLLQKSTPIYPPEAKAAGIQGSVVLRAVIAVNGSVKALQVISGPKELMRSAMESVALWVYRPYLLNGMPTEVETTVTVNYTHAP